MWHSLLRFIAFNGTILADISVFRMFVMYLIVN